MKNTDNNDSLFLMRIVAEKYYTDIYRLCHAYLKNKNDARKCTKEVFILVQKNSHKIFIKRGLKKNIYKIAQKTIKEFPKTKKHDNINNNKKEKPIKKALAITGALLATSVATLGVVAIKKNSKAINSALSKTGEFLTSELTKLKDDKTSLYLSLVKVEVSKKIDTVATETAYKAHERVLAGDDFQKVAEELGVEYSATGELADVKNVDGGRSTKAYNMEPGQISDVFVSENGDCYYIIKLLEKNDTQVNYVSLAIPFTEFDNRLKVVREEKRVEEFIKFDEEKNESAIEAPKTEQ